MYSRKVDGKTLSFGHEGVLFKNSFIMYDRQTKSLWVHTMGYAVKGSLKGKQLEFLPSVVTTWGAWKASHPKTTVLVGRKARGFMGAFNLTRDMPRYGLSVGQGREVKLYPYSLLKEKRVVNDEFAGKRIVVFFDEKGVSALAYLAGKRTFTVKDGGVIDDRGKTWDPLAGTNGKDTLTRIPATPWLTGRWKGFYPEGEIYRSR